MTSPRNRMGTRIPTVVLGVVLAAGVGGCSLGEVVGPVEGSTVSGTLLAPQPSQPRTTGAASSTTTTAVPPTTEVVRSVYEVRITGTEGVSYTGRITVGDSVREVEGTVPGTFEVELASDGPRRAKVELRSQQAPGVMKVQLVLDGEVVSQSAGTAGGTTTFTFGLD